MPLPSTAAGQRLLGKSIALLAMTALLAYGCERGKRSPAPAPSAAKAADTTPPSPKPAEPPKTVDAPKPPATSGDAPKPAADAKPAGDEAAKLPPIPHIDLPPDAKPLNEMTTPSGATVQQFKTGEGTPAFPKSVVTMHFVLRLKDGWKKLESTYDNGEPLSTRSDAFVPGFADGIVGMKPGEVRRVIVPPALAWGKDGVKDKEGNYAIPPNATLVYDAELVSVKQVLVEPSNKPKPKPAAGAAPAAAPAATPGK